MAYFDYKGHACWYEELGEGEPLILLHGNAASSVMFTEIAGEYAAENKVVLIDFMGHGRSERVERFPADLWYDESQQVIELIRQRGYERVSLIGSSGGALVAINTALESPGLVDKVIADSFEGERSLKAFTENVTEEREQSKRDEDSRMFYFYMHGEDWEGVVDNDTRAIAEHDRSIEVFFHKPLETLEPPILLTGSREDEFVCSLGSDFFDRTYGAMLEKIGHGEMCLFETGRHPAMLSNRDEFLKVSKAFLTRTDRAR